jgi:hypothetical protein
MKAAQHRMQARNKEPAMSREGTEGGRGLAKQTGILYAYVGSE